MYTNVYNSFTLLPIRPRLGTEYPIDNQVRHGPSLPGAYILKGRQVLKNSPSNKHLNKI